MSRYQLTVIGDSFSVGWGDPAPHGGYRGWVGRFSSLTGLRPGNVHNVAQCGATSAHAVQCQLPHALAGKASLVVAVVGMNDMLTEPRDYDAGRLQRNLRALFEGLTGRGSTVVTAKYPDVPANLDVSELVRARLRRRFAEANEALADIAAFNGVMCIDLPRRPAWRNVELWDADRIHPGPRLHQNFAEELVSLNEGSRQLVAA